VLSLVLFSRMASSRVQGARLAQSLHKAGLVTLCVIENNFTERWSIFPAIAHVPIFGYARDRPRVR